MFAIEIICLYSALLVFPGNSAAGFARCPSSGQRPGNYSTQSVDLCFHEPDAEHRYLEIPSPNSSTVLVVSDHTAVFRKNGHDIPASFLVGRTQEEVIWSPDSKAVIVTLVLGAAGPASADVAFVEDDPFPRRPPVTSAIRKDFASEHIGDRCWESANVGGLAWLDDSNEAVFIAEVPPSPHCEKNGGYFNAYVVSLHDGRIMKRYEMKEAVKKFAKLLGPGLKADIDLLKDK